MLDDEPAGWSLLGMAGDGRRRPRDDMIVGRNNMTDIQIFRNHSTASGKNHADKRQVSVQYYKTPLACALVSPSTNKANENEQIQSFSW